MKKSMILIGAALALALAGFIIHRNSLSARMSRSGMEQDFALKCTSCTHLFRMNRDEMKRMINSGKARNEPGMYALFPCPKCGNVTASIRDMKYEKDAEKK